MLYLSRPGKELDSPHRPRLFIAVPPYDQFRTSLLSKHLSRVPKGAIILVGHPTPSDVARIAHAAPSALIMVQVRTGDTIGFAEFEKLRYAGASAVLAVGGSAPTLDVLLSGARLAGRSVSGQIGPRLRALARPIPLPLEAALEVVAGCPAAWKTTDWAKALGESVRSLERRCVAQWQVPSPRRWLELVRVIRAVQAVQVHADVPVEFAFAEAGFQSARTARELMTRICGVSPSFARRLIGWQWVIEGWCRRFWGSRMSFSGRIASRYPGVR